MDNTQSKVRQLRPIRPSIIIGLGGTGQRVVLEVRHRIIQEYKEIDRLPIVGFLVVDTDPEKPIIPGVDEDTLRKIQLRPSEFFQASVTGTEKLKRDLNSYPHLSEWVDKSILERGDVTVGAKGIRAIGRLAYFLNFNGIKKSFNTIKSQVTDQPNMRYMAETHGIQVATGVNIFIVTSICGGTGSGMFLDFAFTVKNLLAGTEHNRIGYMVLPGVFGTDMAKASGYAALRELNHYQMDRDFEANWENDSSPKIIQPPPFDFCYLVNNSNGKTNFHQKEHLFEMIAHNIFLEFAHEFGQYKASLKDNVQASAIGTDKLGCPLNYISFGLSTISFPRDRIMKACSYRLAKEVVDRWLTDRGDVGRINEYVEHFLDYNKLFIDTDSARKNQPKDELLKIEGGSNYYARVDEEMTSIVRGLKSQKPEGYNIFVNRREEDLEKKFYEGDKDQNRWGEYFRGIYKNSLKKKEETEKILIETISKMIKSDKEGVDYAKEFLNRLENKFSRYRDYCREKFDALSKAESSFSKAKIREYEKLKSYKKKFIFDKRRVMMDQVDRLTNTRSGKLTIYFKRKIDKKILELMIDLEEQLAMSCRTFIREIDNLKEKMSRLQRSLKDSEKRLTCDASGVDVYSLALYDSKDVDKYFKEYINLRDKELDRNTASMVSEEALKLLELSDLFDIRKDDYTERTIREALVNASLIHFEEIKKISVAKKFFEKYPTESEQVMALRNVFAQSEVFLNFRHVPDFTRLPNSKVSLIGVYEGRQPSVTEYKELLPLLEKSCTEPEQLRGIRPILQNDEIIFTTEEGAFPLRMINEIDNYESKYDKLSQGFQNPLHLRKDDKDFLVEIIQPTDSEQRKAKIGTYIGFALGLLKPDPDDPDYVIYKFRDPNTGFIENKPLGKTGEEERIIDTLLHRFNKELRSIIFKDVDRHLRKVAGNKIEKGKIWHKINDYRNSYLKRRDRDFIQKKGIPEIFKGVIEEYKLFDPSFIEDLV